MTITHVVCPRTRRSRSISPPLRRYSVAKVCQNLWAWTPEADPPAEALEEVGDALDVDWAAVSEQE